LNEILSKGFEGQQIISGLALFFRDLLVCKDPQTLILFESGEAVKQKYMETATLCNTQFLYKAIELTNETDLNYRVSKNKRLSIELLLIRLCQLNNPLMEEDKKKILIEPIVEFSDPVTKPESVHSSVQPIPYSGNGSVENDKSLKQKIVRVRIKDEIEQQENVSATETPEIQDSTESFTEDQLRTVWRNCANDLTDKHLKSILNYLNPELKETDTIEIYALNPEQVYYIQQNIRQITDYLSIHLKNNRIKIEVRKKEDNTEQTPFTAQEKFVYMADKNPALKKIVQEFNLKLD